MRAASACADVIVSPAEGSARDFSGVLPFAWPADCHSGSATLFYLSYVHRAFEEMSSDGLLFGIRPVRGGCHATRISSGQGPPGVLAYRESARDILAIWRLWTILNCGNLSTIC